MVESKQPEPIALGNEEALQTLARSLQRSQGKFKLIVARCNYPGWREQLVPQLREQYGVEVATIVVPRSARRLYQTLRDRLEDRLDITTLMVCGLESAFHLNEVLRSAKQDRDKFQSRFPFPIVLWATDEISRKLMRLAPDFDNWVSLSLEFTPPPTCLIQLLHQRTEEALDLNADCPLTQGELESFESDLPAEELNSKPALQASLAFLRGRVEEEGDRLDAALAQYRTSGELWQQQNQRERQGIAATRMALVCNRQAEQKRSQRQDFWQRSQTYFQQGIDCFEQVRRTDLVAQVQLQLGEVLLKREDWQGLQQLCDRALEFYVREGTPSQIAHLYGFRAEVALQESQWKAGKESAELALELLEQAGISEPNCSWYRLLRARSWQHLGKAAEAIASLERAQAECQPQDDLTLSLAILEALRSVHFQQHNYREAFSLKRERQKIESEYGLRAFVGAGRLQPPQTLMQQIEGETEVDREVLLREIIVASGRERDVEALIERMERADCKLTVLHGQSGVGKSSIVQAGFIPALRLSSFKGRDAIWVLVQVYDNWVREIGEKLTPSGTGTEAILAQLRRNSAREQLTVLIFDQFEEFFFVCRDLESRKPFYEFLNACLPIPYVKVVLSLREDYLHYLLECSRATDLEFISGNILDKNILHYVGNFKPPDAKAVIESLTARSQFELEPQLVEALVTDLAGELGEVRPIELQVVGAQLQQEKVTTLAQYREIGEPAKEKLVERFLGEVVADCGAENEQIAKLVLYLLTDENFTRPLKTRADLTLELDVSTEKLDLILTILVQAGLLLRVPARPEDRYQLVHDYLVSFVRREQSARLIADLEREREQRKLTEAKLNKALRKELKAARRATFTLLGLLGAIGSFALLATFAVANTYITNLTLGSEKNQELDRVVSAIKAAKTLKQWSWGTLPETRQRVILELNAALHTTRELSRFEGHTEAVNYVAVSDDGKLLGTASADDTTKIWSSEGEELETLKGHDDDVVTLAFSPDGKKVATASKDTSVKIWNVEDGKLLNTLSGYKAEATSIAFSPDGEKLVIASRDKMVKIWTLDGQQLHAKETKAIVTLIQFSPNGKLLALASQDDTVMLWDLEKKNEKPTILDNYGTLEMHFSEDSKHITLVNKDRTIKSWTTDGILSQNIYYCCVSSVSKSAFDIRRKNRATVDFDDPNSVEIYKVNQWSFADSYYPQDNLGYIEAHDDTISHILFDNRKSSLITAGKDKKIKIWKIDPSTLIKVDIDTRESINIASSSSNKYIAMDYEGRLEIRNKEDRLLTIIPPSQFVLQFSPDENILTENTGKFVTLVNFSKTGKTETILDDRKVNDIHLNKGKNNVVSISNDRKVIKVWDYNGKLLNKLNVEDTLIKDFFVSPNGEIIAIINKNNKILLWNLKNNWKKTLNGHTEVTNIIAFSSDSQFFASTGDDSFIKLWKSNGELIKIIKNHDVRIKFIKFIPNSRTLIAISGRGFFNSFNTIKFWNKNGILINAIDAYNTQGLILESNKKIAASLPSQWDELNNNINLWNIKSINKGHFEFVESLDDHKDKITKLVFSLNGKLIATGSADNRVKLWSHDGKKLYTLRGHTDAIRSIEFSPDSQTIATLSDDYTAKLWNSNNGKLIKTLQLANDAFKPPEKRNFEDEVFIDIKFRADDKLVTAISNPKDEKTHLKLFNSKGVELKHIVKDFYSDSISFSTDGQTIALVNKDNSLKLWSLKGKPLATFSGHRNQVNDATFSPDGKLIASASNDQTVKLWHPDGRLYQNLEGHEDKVKAVAFSSDGEQVASGGEDKVIKLWNKEGNFIQDFTGHTGKIQSIIFSPDRKTIVSSSDDNTVKFWNRKSGKVAHSLNWNNNRGNQLSFNPSGSILALPQYQTLNFYFPKSWWFKETEIETIYPVSNITFGADGKSMILSGDRGVFEWSLDLDELLRQGCDRARNHLKHNKHSVKEGDRNLCKGIESNQTSKDAK